MTKKTDILKVAGYICLSVILVFSLMTIAGCGGGGDDAGGGEEPGTNTFTGGLSGTWEGGMYPGNGIDFEVEEINGENYVISASGWYVAIGCINRDYSWEANDLQNKIVNNECHIYFPDDLNFGDGRGMELHIYFDSDTELHGTWVGETFCKPLIEGTLRAYHCIDKDNDGYDTCDECDDDNADINPDADEICDGVDNDCDGKIDEGLFYPDKDKDGYGDATAVGQSCPVPEGYVSDNTDCNDNDSTIKPGEIEILGDGIDQNCDDEIDEAGPRFTDLSDGTVRDNLSGLIWLKEDSCDELSGTNSDGSADWNTAIAAAAGLADGTCALTDASTEGDWRLPTYDEWWEFVRWEGEDTPLGDGSGHYIWNSMVFSGLSPSWLPTAEVNVGYWTSTVEGAEKAWIVRNFPGGAWMQTANQGDSRFVWPVRSDN